MNFWRTGQVILQKVLHFGSACSSLIIRTQLCMFWSSQVALVVKNVPANARDVRDSGSILWLGRSPGGGRGNPPEYSYLENPMDRGAWQAMVHWVTKSWTRLKWLSTHVCKSGPNLTMSLGQGGDEDLDAHRAQTMWRHWEKAAKERGFRRDQSCPQLVLGLPASGTLRKGISAV